MNTFYMVIYQQGGICTPMWNTFVTREDADALFGELINDESITAAYMDRWDSQGREIVALYGSKLKAKPCDAGGAAMAAGSALADVFAPAC